MSKLRIVVEHRIKQVVVLDVSRDDLANMTYDDALANVPFDEFQTSEMHSDIVDVTVDGEEHYF